MDAGSRFRRTYPTKPRSEIENVVSAWIVLTGLVVTCPTAIGQGACAPENPIQIYRMIESVLAVLDSPFKSKSRLEDENAALRHQLIVLRSKRPASLAHEQRSLVLPPDVSMVSFDPEGREDYPA
jgi:hypothetical protein